MGRAPCCEKVGLKRGRWTSSEDDILTKYIHANGEGSWRSLPKNAGLLRCGKSCRLRWINYLRDDLKRGNISGEEEAIIIKLHASFGNKWSLIASQLPGRTDNEIKNYWNSHLSRKIDTFRRPNSEPLPIIMNLGISSSSTSKKKGGRTSRAAMKKNKSYTKTTTTTTKIVKTNMVKVKESGGDDGGGGDGGVIMSLPSTPILERETLPISTMDFDSMFVEEIERSVDDDPHPHHHHQEPDQMVEDVLAGPPHGVGSFNDMLIINHPNEVSESGGGGGGCSSTTTNSSNNFDDGQSSSSGGKVVDWDWDWEDLIHDNFWNEQEQQHQDQEQDQMLSWLWDSNDNYNNVIGGEGQIQNLLNFGVGGMDNSENQDAIVDWLLS